MSPLLQIAHPFVTNKFAGFVTPCNLILIMEFCPGGDLFDQLYKHKAFSVPDTRIFVSQVMLPLEYLHGMSIVHRDLKLENILVAQDGALKLTDFGFAKHIKYADQTKPNRTEPNRTEPSRTQTKPNANRTPFAGTARGRFAARPSTSRQRSSLKRATARPSTTGRWASSFTRCSTATLPLRPRTTWPRTPHPHPRPHPHPHPHPRPHPHPHLHSSAPASPSSHSQVPEDPRRRC